jgi:hypothetical protein
VSLLTALQDAQRFVGLPVTASIVGDTQETTGVLFALAKREVRELRRRHDWPTLVRTNAFTASTASLQASGKPSDFDRIIPDTFWNRTTDRKVEGPLSPQEWAIAYGAPITSDIQQYWMLRNDGVHVFPVPGATDSMAYEYVIKQAWETSGGSGLDEPTADSDVCRISEHLLTLGVIWRWRQSKGLDYAEDLKSYELDVAREINAQRSARVLSIAPQDGDYFLPIVPDSGFGVAI